MHKNKQLLEKMQINSTFLVTNYNFHHTIINQKRNPKGFLFCGVYVTRTRDPLRDRQVF